MAPTLQDIRDAAGRIAGVAVPTPLRAAGELSRITSRDVHLKLETEQLTGSFKVRGAANSLLQLDDRDRGVVAVSSGNHGRAVAHVAAELGIAATICLSSRVPPLKVEAIRALGATVVVAGPDQDDADAAARALVDDGLVFIHPFDDPRVIAGQGTIGLEILDQIEAGSVVVPLSGGGLAGGIAVAISAVAPDVPVIGVSQGRGPAMVRSLAAGHLVEVEEEDTLADALAGGLGPENLHSFDLCRRFLHSTALVGEEQIGEAMALLYEAEGVTAEGGGAVGAAALLAGVIDPPDPVVIVVSGGNVAPETLDAVLQRAAGS